MFKNYFKTAWRNLWKNRFSSAINIAGLAIGMAACIIIMLFVFYEKSFDSLHSKNIYRLDEVQKFEGMVAPQNVALSMYPMGPTLKAEFPEVRNFTRVRSNSKVDLTYKDKKIFFPSINLVDSTFLEIFDFKLLKGNRATALQKPNSMLLTVESAEKLFGKEDPMGKTVVRYVGDTTPFTITGILENVPENSHLQFDGLASFSTIARPEFMNNWGGNWLVTYLELAPNTNIAAMEKKFPDYLKRHMAEGENWKHYELFLQSLKDVHAKSGTITHDYNNYQKFDSQYTYVFSIIAFIILLIACINFMNLSTARSAERAKEVGIRKTIGAERLQLAVQFIGESVLLALIALVLAVTMVKLFLPSVNNLSQRQLDLPLFSNFATLAVIIAAALLVGLVAGLYPAAYLSSFKPIKVLKGSVQTGKNKSLLRNVLVVGQFTGAVFLIISTVFAVRQLRYMQNKDAGFNREQVMIIPLDRATSQKYESFKQEFQKSSLVTAVSASQQTLGNNLHQTGVVFHGDGPARELTTSQVVVDYDYLTLYKIPLVAGRNFSKDYATDNAKAYIVNETMAKELLKGNPKAKYESLLGRHYGFGGMDSAGTIVGVAKDFNFNSLHHKIETLSILCQKDWGFSEISVRINAAKAGEAITYVESVWKRLAADHPFEYSFLDEHFEELYRADKAVSEIVGVLATLAVIISCLGLFGLASYSAERRVKEIGIRKVLGASVQNIVGMLSRDFVRLVVIANLIAWPLAWFAVYKWLQDFAYRINISWWIFLVAGIIAVLIALATVGFQAIKAAISNPVKSLRTE
ncbi:ABC transporter permease [Foetidibacter luteolus]|uniref:ABC transporter permease n=1 Tax=Foetidibacter luteolus TaxID=2608880 RepID=UPI00129AF54D|nr:ABC transporter permease [Foetidibacter luteolus]